MRKIWVYFSFVFVAAVGLAACGDDDGDLSSRPGEQPDDVIASVDDLSNCTARKMGNVEVIGDTSYVCAEYDGKYKWLKVSQLDDEPDDFKVCNQKREGQYALAYEELILYACSDEEWKPVLLLGDDAEKSSSSGKKANSSSGKKTSSSSAKKTGSSSSKSKSSDSDKDTEISSGGSSGSESSSGGKSSSSDKSSSSETSSSMVAGSSSTPPLFSSSVDESVYDAQNNTLTDYRDGQTYRTVTIGSQTWMAENLNYKRVNSVCFKDSIEYCAKYGRLYTWAAAMGASESKCGYGNACRLSSNRGACPKGWHLPEAYEWQKLFTEVGEQIEARMLKSDTGWNDNGNGRDVYSFAVLPAGYADYRGFDGVGYFALFWTSTEDGNPRALSVEFSYGDSYVCWPSSIKDDVHSVRCIKD